MSGSVTTRSLSLRGGSGASDAAIHRVSNYVYDLSLRLLVLSGSPRAFSPRDDKVWWNAVGGSVASPSLSLRGKSGARDAAIHRGFQGGER